MIAAVSKEPISPFISNTVLFPRHSTITHSAAAARAPVCGGIPNSLSISPNAESIAEYTEKENPTRVIRIIFFINGTEDISKKDLIQYRRCREEILNTAYTNIKINSVVKAIPTIPFIPKTEK